MCSTPRACSWQVAAPSTHRQHAQHCKRLLTRPPARHGPGLCRTRRQTRLPRTAGRRAAGAGEGGAGRGGGEVTAQVGHLASLHNLAGTCLHPSMAPGNTAQHPRATHTRAFPLPTWSASMATDTGWCATAFSSAFSSLGGTSCGGWQRDGSEGPEEAGSGGGSNPPLHMRSTEPRRVEQRALGGKRMMQRSLGHAVCPAGAPGSRQWSPRAGPACSPGTAPPPPARKHRHVF